MTLPIAILCGGLGTRLWPLTRLMPKCLVKIEGKPFLQHQLDLLKAAGFKEVVLCLGYLGEMVEQYIRFGGGGNYSLVIWTSHDGKTPLGTGGALKKALPLLGESFFVMYGDSYLDCDYAAVERSFRSSGKQGLMTLCRSDHHAVRGNVRYEQGEIRSYLQRSPVALSHTDYGLSILSADAFKYFPMQQEFDLAAVWRWLIANKELAAYEIDQRFYEIGSPLGLEEFRRHISENNQKG